MRFEIALPLFPEKVDQNCKKDAEDDRCGKGEIEGEVLLSDKDVTGEFTDPWNFGRNEEQCPQDYQDETEKDEESSKISHFSTSLIPFITAYTETFQQNALFNSPQGTRGFTGLKSEII